MNAARYRSRVGSKGSVYHATRFRLSACVALALVAALLQGAVHIAWADGGAPNLAYVVGGGSGGSDLDVIDMGKRSVSWHITLASAPNSVLLSADGHQVFVTEPAANQVIFLGARSHHQDVALTLGGQPTAMALDLSSSPNALYVTESVANRVTVVDTSKRRLLATIPVGSHPGGIAIAGSSGGIPDPHDAQVYVANAGSDTVSVISSRQRRVVATIPVPGGPLGVVIPASGGVAYISTHDGAIVAIDLAHQTPLGDVLRTPGDVFGVMDYDAVTGQIYVPDATANQVDVLAPVSITSSASGPAMSVPHEPTHTIVAPGQPAAAAITFDGAYALVAEPGDGTLAILDAVTRGTLKRVQVGGQPRAVITGAYPSLVSQTAAFIIDVLFIGAILLMPLLFYVSERRRQRRKRQRAATTDATTPVQEQ